MLLPARAWQLRQTETDLVAEIEHELRVSRLTARLLALRGVHGRPQAEAWLGKRLTDLHKPGLMRDMDRAAARLAEAINRRERILIHGDYDVDGTTAASLLHHFVAACSHHATVWIPHRRIDGYGLSESSLQAVREHQAQVLVTVDCGIADLGWAARIEAETGCQVIITDHHLPQAVLPACHAVVNPNRRDCTYPDKGLAGVGVAWKLAWATATVLCGSDKVTERLRGFLTDALALVAVGTVADCAPLTGENRILVHHGLTALGRSTWPGLRTLLDGAGLAGESLSAGEVGWKVGPLLNAAGRVGSAMATIQLLTAHDAAAAQAALKVISGENEERKRLTQALSADLIAEAERDPATPGRATLVFAGEGWHPGVVGIVAGRLAERFGRPAAVIAVNDGHAKGSLRTVPSVHLGDAIDACRHCLIQGGGHAMAAGIVLDPARIPDFRTAFEGWVAGRVAPGSLVPRTQVDALAGLTELDQDFFAALERMGPFGNGNAEPVIQLSGARFVARPRSFGANGDHLKIAVTDDGGGMRELLVWRAKEHLADLSAAGARFDLLVRPECNRWRGELTPRLVFVDGKTL